MSCVFMVAVAANICSVAAPYVSSEQSQGRYAQLAELSIPEDALPPGCSIPENLNPPIKGVNNRQVTTDPRAFVLTDDEVTREFQRNVKAMYYAVYREGNELGILAWAFDRPETARKAHRVMTDKQTDKQQFKFWCTGEYVILLWRDKGTSDNCFQNFATFIQKKFDRFEETGS